MSWHKITFEKGYQELENMIKDMSYHNKMNVNNLLNCPDKNDEYSQV